MSYINRETGALVIEEGEEIAETELDFSPGWYPGKNEVKVIKTEPKEDEN